MPTNKYYGGHGESIMRSMKERYGEKGEEVFYATANKHKQTARSRRPSVEALHKSVK